MHQLTLYGLSASVLSGTMALFVGSLRLNGITFRRMLPVRRGHEPLRRPVAPFCYGEVRFGVSAW